MSHHDPWEEPSRRQFLGESVGGVSALFVAGHSAAASARVLGANDRVNIGLIGVGIMGFGHLRQLVNRSKSKADVQLVAACDIYTRRKKRAQEQGSLAAKDIHHDYRELLQRSDVDAVVIATPDHWHARQALDALNAGKDVYLQKPMTYTIEEAREVAAAVKRTKRVLQVGSQHVSDLRYHHAKEVIEKGLIGTPIWAQSANGRNSLYGEWNYLIEEDGTEENIDWKAFLGSAPKRPFNQDRYFRWRKYWDYSGGIATDLYYHELAPLLFAMGPQFPVRVTGQGGIYIHKDREVPDSFATTIEYENSYIVISSSMAAAASRQGMPEIIYGHEGTIWLRPDHVQVTPERAFVKKFRDTTGQPELKIPVPRQNIQDVHMDNFIACVHSRQQPVLDADLGYQVMTAIKLGVDSYRHNRMMAFDPRTQRVIRSAPERPAYPGTGKNTEESHDY